jgi:hypothetical protein
VVYTVEVIGFFCFCFSCFDYALPELCYDLWFTEVCASGYQDRCGIMRLFRDYLEMCAEIALCTITMLHWTRFL